VPLHVIATDVWRGEEVRLSNGPLLERCWLARRSWVCRRQSKGRAAR
jgi:hypothetical protein